MLLRRHAAGVPLKKAAPSTGLYERGRSLSQQAQTGVDILVPSVRLSVI